MEFKTMETVALEERKVAISEEMETEGADLDALLEEVRGINEELESRKAEEAKKVELREMVANGAGEVQEEIETEEVREETEKMEVRNSVEYINAFADYIKTGKDNECRALLSTNATNGQVPVPEFIEGRIRTAWERSELMNLVRKTYLRGNVKVGFELSATGAVVHTEGAAAPDEEVLTFGIVTMVPESIKKWITISDEAIDMGGREFLEYIYDELTYRIAKYAESMVLDLIANAPTTSSATEAAVKEITAAGSELATVDIINAVGQLSGDARNLVLVTSRQYAAQLKAAALSANFAYDPFDGLRVVYSDIINDESYLAVVGDFTAIQANFPNGDEIRVLRDDYSLAEKDLVKFVGREYVGMGIVAPNALCRIVAGE